MSEEVKLDTKELDKILKKLSANIPGIKVGILGENAKREAGEKNNADIGYKHEFGMDGMPIRSFLRMPLQEELPRNLEKMNFENLEPEDMAHKIGVAAVTTIHQAFDSGGFGEWMPSKKSSGKTLIDSGQLFKSINYEIEK